MVGQFDPSGSRNVVNARKYLESLGSHSPSSDGVGATTYGAWTLIKHIFLSRYLTPFFQIGSLNFRRIVYVDMFGGPGLNWIPSLDRTFITPGSPLISYAYSYRDNRRDRTERFDSYYFYETDRERAGLLASRLTDVQRTFGFTEPPHVINGDSVEDIWRLISKEADCLAQPKKTTARKDTGLLFLLFIDPEGLGIDFAGLKQLLKRYVAEVDEPDGKKAHYTTADVIYTAPTSAVLRSNNPDYVTKYCGVDRSHYQDLPEELASAMSEAISRELGGRGFVGFVPAKNTKNSILYHVFFITKTKGAYDAAMSIMKKIRLSTSDLESCLRVVYGESGSLDRWCSSETPE